MAWFEHEGSRIYYEDEGTGEEVLLLPGWGGTIEEFRPLREALATEYRVIAADLPGSGRSGPQPRLYTESYYEDDSETLLLLLERVAPGGAHLVGFSDGGEYALRMAELRPDLVRSVVAWGAAGKLVEPMLGMLDAFYNLMEAPIEPLRDFAEYMKASYGETNARLMVQSFTNALRAKIAVDGDISRASAGEIRCPVLLISGENDFLATPSLAADMAAAIPNGRHVEVKGAGHDVHRSHGDWLARTVVDWLPGPRARIL
jgi:valacyclovir hydrolase